MPIVLLVKLYYCTFGVVCMRVWIGVGGVGHKPILTPGCLTTDQTVGM